MTPGRHGTVEERFWPKVDKSTGESGCWEFIGSRNIHGYGKLRVGATDKGAHRISWELANGPIPDGLFVCHSCDNPPCVNPAHLWLGTHQENDADKVAKGRTPKPNSHCPSGHEFTHENTYRYRGGRRCRECALARVYARRKRLQEARREGTS